MRNALYAVKGASPADIPPLSEYSCTSTSADTLGTNKTSRPSDSNVLPRDSVDRGAELNSISLAKNTPTSSDGTGRSNRACAVGDEHLGLLSTTPKTSKTSGMGTWRTGRHSASHSQRTATSRGATRSPQKATKKTAHLRDSGTVKPKRNRSAEITGHEGEFRQIRKRRVNFFAGAP